MFLELLTMRALFSIVVIGRSDCPSISLKYQKVSTYRTIAAFWFYANAGWAREPTWFYADMWFSASIEIQVCTDMLLCQADSGSEIVTSITYCHKWNNDMYISMWKNMSCFQILSTLRLFLDALRFWLLQHFMLTACLLLCLNLLLNTWMIV